MKRGLPAPGSGLAALILLIAGTACNLTLRPASSGTPQVIVITATGQTRGAETPDQAMPSDESAPTFTPTITPTATAVAPTMTAGQELSCVKGPHWIFYEWVAKILEDETVTLLAKASEDWEEYYWIRKSDGTECWAFGGSSTKTGDYLNLPVREAPPLPEVNYTIQNKTLMIILEVYIREKDSTDWGSNRISGPLYADETFSITLTAGFYDVLVKDVATGPLYEKYDWPIGSEPTYRNIVLNQEVNFFIQNNYAFDLCDFALRPAGGSGWKTIHSGTDGHITPGSKLEFTILPGFYDLEIHQCPSVMVVSIGGLYFGPALPGYTFP